MKIVLRLKWALVALTLVSVPWAIFYRPDRIALLVVILIGLSIPISLVGTYLSEVKQPKEK